MRPMANRCPGTGQPTVRASDGVWDCCAVCGMWTIPFRNGNARKHNRLVLSRSARMSDREQE